MFSPATMAALNEQPTSVLSNQDGSQYIPIGVIEKKLDEIFSSWNTSNWRSSIIIITGKEYYDASVELIVFDKESKVTVTKTGSVTFPIFEMDDNKNYAATALSFCIANAAKRLGKVFGRELNNRMTTLDTASTGINSSAPDTSDKDNAIAKEFEKVKKLVTDAKDKSSALSIMAKNGFKYNQELTAIANSKTNK